MMCCNNCENVLVIVPVLSGQIVRYKNRGVDS